MDNLLLAQLDNLLLARAAKKGATGSEIGWTEGRFEAMRQAWVEGDCQPRKEENFPSSGPLMKGLDPEETALLVNVAGSGSDELNDFLRKLRKLKRGDSVVEELIREMERGRDASSKKECL